MEDGNRRKEKMVTDKNGREKVNQKHRILWH